MKKIYLFLILAFISLLIILLVVLLSSNSPKKERLLESGFNSVFSFNTELPFKKYIEYEKDIITKARVDLKSKNLSNSEKNSIINNNAPFIYDNSTTSKKCIDNNKAILMIHGLTDSPFVNRDLANYFRNEKCFNVYSILLVGHGTRPGDLLSVNYKSWIEQVNYAINEISKTNNNIYISGFSTGAALALDYVLEGNNFKNKNISGLILFSPAVDLPSLVFITPIIKYFKKYLNVYDDIDHFKYESFATNAAVQVYYLTKRIKNKINKYKDKLKNIKIFTAISYEDHTINSKSSLKILMNNLQHNKNNSYFILYHQKDAIIPKKYYKISNLKLVNSTIEKQKILSVSHLAITNKPSNFYYGKNGIYKNCLHYFSQKNKYQSCLKSPINKINKGEITRKNLKKGLMQRITYNPFWQEMVNDIEKFFNF